MQKIKSKGAVQNEIDDIQQYIDVYRKSVAAQQEAEEKLIKQ